MSAEAFLISPMKKFFFLALITCFVFSVAPAQELFTYMQPASNLPANSVAVKLSAQYLPHNYSSKTAQRYTPEVLFGLEKNYMMRAGVSFSNIDQNMSFESAKLYGQYRFFSADEVHKHLRMAVFYEAAYSRNNLAYNEINFGGDHTGVSAGLIATQLWNRFAVSATGSWNEVLHSARGNKGGENNFAFTAVNYALSTGYLVLPVEYKSYDQTNINVYAELLGSRIIGNVGEKYFLDLAPSIQAIFKSAGKLSLGYRFQLSGDVARYANDGFLISYEHLFLRSRKK